MIERKSTKKLYEKGKNQNPSHKEKQKNYDHLVELVNTLNKKENIYIYISWP